LVRGAVVIIKVVVKQVFARPVPRREIEPFDRAKGETDQASVAFSTNLIGLGWVVVRIGYGYLSNTACFTLHE